MTRTEALRKLYKKVTNEEAPVTANTITEVLVALADKYSGDEPVAANTITDALVALADNYSGGGGSSDFSTAQVTVKLAGERSAATFDVYLQDLLTSDANGLVAAEEDNIRYFTTDAQVIELDKPSHVEETKVIYLYKNNPVYVAYRLAESTAVYTITGSGEVVALNIDDSTIYAVKVTGDCTITIS